MTEKTQEEIKKVVKTQDDKLKRVGNKVEKPKEVKLKKVKVQPIKAKAVKKKFEKKELKPYTLRSQATGDKVFLIKGGKRYWVMNPISLARLGFSIGQEQNVDFSELRKFPEGSPIDLTKPGETAKKVEKKIEKEAKEEPKKEESDKPYKVWS